MAKRSKKIDRPLVCAGELFVANTDQVELASDLDDEISIIVWNCSSKKDALARARKFLKGFAAIHASKT